MTLSGCVSTCSGKHERLKFQTKNQKQHLITVLLESIHLSTNILNLTFLKQWKYEILSLHYTQYLKSFVFTYYVKKVHVEKKQHCFFEKKTDRLN